MAKAESSAPSEAMPGIEDWRRLIEKAMKGRGLDTLRSETSDGISIEPLYAARRDAFPLGGRGARAWVLVQCIDDSDPDRANEQARHDVLGGATGLALRFADREGGTTGLPPSREALRIALDGVDPGAISLRVEPHSEGLKIAEHLRDFIAKRGNAPEGTKIAFGLDPMKAAIHGKAAPDTQKYAAVFLALRAAHFRGSLATLDGRAFHEAGASEAQELAAILAAAAWWLRALEKEDASPEIALPHLSASLSVDHDVLVSIAKLRATRLAWARLVEVCDTPPVALKIHAETSRRMLMRGGVDNNLLRNTLAAFAAGVGGADSVHVTPHNAALGAADRDARALARNLQHLLMQESHLHRVTDPAAGSGAIEALSDALAERAWAAFQEIEREGGITESLRAGHLQQRIADARGNLAARVTGGALPIVGVSVYLDEARDEAGAKLKAKDSSARGLGTIRLEDFATVTA